MGYENPYFVTHGQMRSRALSRGFVAAICSSTALVRTLPTTAAEGMAAPQSTPLSTSAPGAASVTATSVIPSAPPQLSFGLIADMVRIHSHII